MKLTDIADFQKTNGGTVIIAHTEKKLVDTTIDLWGQGTVNHIWYKIEDAPISVCNTSLGNVMYPEFQKAVGPDVLLSVYCESV